MKDSWNWNKTTKWTNVIIIANELNKDARREVKDK